MTCASFRGATSSFCLKQRESRICTFTWALCRTDRRLNFWRSTFTQCWSSISVEITSRLIFFFFSHLFSLLFFLQGSRPIVSFDAGFDKNGEPHWVLMKELLLQIFATPKHHKRSKPFIDHVISFSRLDDSIWMRNYQISTAPEQQEPQLVEVGPRVTLTPVRIFEGSLKWALINESVFFLDWIWCLKGFEKKKDLLQSVFIKILGCHALEEQCFCCS